jgi:hypothetical protein
VLVKLLPPWPDAEAMPEAASEGGGAPLAQTA